MNQDNFLLIASSTGVALFATCFVYKRLQRHRARHWPTVRGQVDSTAVRYQSGGDLAGAWVATVNYHCGMPGRSHAGIHAHNFVNKDRAEHWVAHYIGCQSLRVRVNPHQPERSILLESDRV